MSQMPPQNQDYQPYESEKTSGLAIGALVTGILGMCVFPVALVALILGILALGKTKPGGEKGRGFAITGIVLGGTGLTLIPIVALLIAILLPALGAARRTARRMQNATQVRGIHQGMITFANSNRGYFPGMDSRGNILADGVDTGLSGDGDTPQARYWVLLDGNFFTPEYAISPSEVQLITPYLGSGPVTADNYSYAMLDYDTTGQPSVPSTGLTSGQAPAYAVDPATAARASEWRDTLNSQAVVMSDRNTGLDASTQIQSIHTDPGDWRGTVLWNDGAVGFENTYQLTTRYGNGAINNSDNLFMDDGAPNGADAVLVHDK